MKTFWAAAMGLLFFTDQANTGSEYNVKVLKAQYTKNIQHTNRYESMHRHKQLLPKTTNVDITLTIHGILYHTRVEKQFSNDR